LGDGIKKDSRRKRNNCFFLFMTLGFLGGNPKEIQE
jgi:hypothetical protein